MAEKQVNGKEDCVTFINNFCEAELEKTGIVQHIERTHRVGGKIVLKCSSFREKKGIRKEAIKLRGSRYRIQEQYTRDVYEQRKQPI